MTETKRPRHCFSSKGLCIACGRSRAFIAKHGGGCLGDTSVRRAKEPPAPAGIVVLALPLEIIPASDPDEPDVAELGALLVSAENDARVAGAVRAPAGRFDADAAFRELDDLRSRAETVYLWVSESLEAEATSALTHKKLARWKTLPWFAAVLPLLAYAVAPDDAVVLVAGWLYAAFALFVCVAVGLSFGVPGWVGASVLALLFLGIGKLAAGSLVASVLFLTLLVTFGGLFIASLVAQRKERALTVHVVEEGEAVQHEPELCLAGDEAALSVGIRCTAGDGRLMRYVTLGVASATRESAASAARAALEPDAKYARERVEREAAEEAASDALKRVADLERERRSLPGG